MHKRFQTLTNVTKRKRTEYPLFPPPTLSKQLPETTLMYHSSHNQTNVMNAIKNKVQLIGRLGAKVEFRTLEGGKAMARLNLATNETYRNAKGEKVEETTWHHLIAWGKTAEILNKYT